MKKSTKKILPEKITPTYQITFKMGEEVYQGQGESVYAALASMKRPAKIMTKAFLTLTDGHKSFTKMYMPSTAKRLFYKVAQPLQAKSLAFLLK